MKWLTALLMVALLGLQYRLWFGEGNLLSVWSLQQAIAQQEAENARLSTRNRKLEAEVRDLKQGVSALEERARSELGMVREGETFLQIVEDP